MRRACSVICIALILPLVAVVPASFADQRATNWTGNFSRCDKRFELLRRESMTLGVKISTSNPLVAREFRGKRRFRSASDGRSSDGGESAIGYGVEGY